MPTWNPPPGSATSITLKEILNELSVTVRTNPDFERLLGLKFSELTTNAMDAVAVIAAHSEESAANLPDLVQLYCLGFVVGSRYGELRHQHTSHEKKE